MIGLKIKTITFFIVAIVIISCNNESKNQWHKNMNHKEVVVNNKKIYVKGWKESELEKIIKDFINNYRNDGYPEFLIDKEMKSSDYYKLTFPKDIPPLLFTFLINYLMYPFDFELNHKKIFVIGAATLSSEFEGIDNSSIGKNAILYVPENDNDYDIVYLKTQDGIDYANSFTTTKWKQVNKDRLSSELKEMLKGI